MNLKEKLRQLDKSGPPAAPAQPPSRALDDVEAVASMLGGEVVENDSGAFIRFRYVIPLSRRHGSIELSLIEEISGHSVEAFSKKSVPHSFNLTDAVYIDTETTGLAGGTGTYVFLIGAGYIENNNFVIEQLFLPRLADELAMLEYLNSLVSERNGLVSFNGKSFDIPLLVTRCIANRLQPVLNLHQHLDLLHAARRIWKQDYGNCRLGTLESALMGFERYEDIPGEEIPYIYMEFLRYGHTERLTPVLSHNKLDIASLVALVIVLAEKVEQRDVSDLPAQQVQRLARLHAENKAFERAAEIFHHMQNHPELTENEKSQHILAQAQVQKRLGNFEQAISLWQQSTGFGSLALEAFVELAKYYEHREKDFQTALDYTQKATSILKTRASLRGQVMMDEAQQLLQHRAKRLQRKIAKRQK
ncbi:MAG: ribonuclease H-like domain-containing protein [Deferribacteres bacterium]|nr:ribonuclease H-like domain-containing protein [Deferribacteres bacterium]